MSELIDRLVPVVGVVLALGCAAGIADCVTTPGYVQGDAEHCMTFAKPGKSRVLGLSVCVRKTKAER